MRELTDKRHKFVDRDMTLSFTSTTSLSKTTAPPHEVTMNKSMTTHQLTTRLAGPRDGSLQADTTTTELSIESLLHRCRALHNELESFREHLKHSWRETTIESSHYRHLVKSELNNIERLASKQLQVDNKENHDSGSDQDDLDDEQRKNLTHHTLSSSNLPFLEGLWNVAKHTTGLIALNKRFYYGPDVHPTNSRPGARRARTSPLRTNKAMVDIVAQDGLEWIKLSLVTNHRMLMDQAREGWAEDDTASDSSGSHSDTSPTLSSSIPIVRMAEGLVQAAKLVRIRTRRPRIRIIMPRVVEHTVPAIDAVLARLRAMDVSVECESHALTPRSLPDALPTLITDPFKDFTDTVNVDCTLLLAFVSDFSHTDVADEVWFHRALKRQIELEAKEHLLPNILYPAVANRRLVCTAAAAKRMQEIVDTIGTESEQARTAILFDSQSSRMQDLQTAFNELSRFDVPDSLLLPISILDDNVNENVSDKLPQVADKVSAVLTPINQSVFMYGWRSGCTTITSNRTVVKQIDAILDQEAHSECDWPRVWLCPTARSLVGKDKYRRA